MCCAVLCWYLQVAVADGVFVAVLQPEHDLRCQPEALLSVQPALADDVVEQLSSLDVFQHEVQSVFCLQHVVQFEHVRVLDEFEYGYLALHLLPQLRLAVQVLLVDDLERHLEARVLVSAQPHSARTAATQHGTENERTDVLHVTVKAGQRAEGEGSGDGEGGGALSRGGGGGCGVLRRQ